MRKRFFDGSVANVLVDNIRTIQNRKLTVFSLRAAYTCLVDGMMMWQESIFAIRSFETTEPMLPLLPSAGSCPPSNSTVVSFITSITIAIDWPIMASLSLGSLLKKRRNDIVVNKNGDDRQRQERSDNSTKSEAAAMLANPACINTLVNWQATPNYVRSRSFQKNHFSDSTVAFDWIGRRYYIQTFISLYKNWHYAVDPSLAWLALALPSNELGTFKVYRVKWYVRYTLKLKH